MLSRPCLAAALLAAITFVGASPAGAIDGEVLITHSKALVGNVTPGDGAGYPITISRAGSYKLASNLQVSANVAGIQVTATEVSIDLAGFRMNGANTATYGIVGNQRGLTVRNGTIQFFKNDGVLLKGALSIVDNMRIEENGESGVYEFGAASGFARITNSTIFGNRRYGILCGQGCHIEGNNISRNGGPGNLDGVNIASGTVLGNTIIQNTGWGIEGTPKVGFGNNAIMDNAFAPVLGGLVALHPNACSPPC